MAADSSYRLDSWLAAAVCLIALSIAAEIAFRLGRRARARFDEASRGQLATIQAAVLSLLALLLGFSFAMAEARYETRRQLVIEESNAIGTTFLRAALLPQPMRSEIEQLLERYVDTRLAFHAAGAQRAALRRASEAAERLQEQLWTRGVTAASLDPRAVTTGLFLQSLNQVIDLHAARRVALENRLPPAIIDLLLLVAAVAVALLGYGCGVGGRRQLGLTTLTIVVFVAVMLLIIDFDRPARGFVRVPQQSMIRLRQDLPAAR